MLSKGLLLLSFIATLLKTGLQFCFSSVFDHWVHDHDLSGIQYLHDNCIEADFVRLA